MKTKEVSPEVGMGATIYHWSDRTAATIIQVSGKRIVLQEDSAIRTDKNGMSESQSYDYSPDPNGRLWFATLRKDGNWKVSKSTEIVGIGHRRQYHDYSF